MNPELATSQAEKPALPVFLEKRYVVIFMFVTFLFLMWGLATTMGDILNKHFQNVLSLKKSESALVQFSIYGSYAVMGIPAGIFMKKYGYKSGILLGLLLYAAGALLFLPAADAASFDFFRIALFVLGCGLATLETVAHPFIASLGTQNYSDQRVNLAQAFNGLGGFLGLLIGGYFILRVGETVNNLDSVKQLYTVIGLAVLLVAVIFYFVKVPALPSYKKDIVIVDSSGVKKGKGLFQHKHFIYAVIAQFFNISAQAGTWAFFINYGVEKAGITAERVAYFFALSMVIKIAGRFIGTFLMMKYIRPNKLLALFALGNILMCLIVAQGWGYISFAALIMINFFFSIMVPTIYSLGMKDLGEHIHKGSSYLIMSVLGGALFPSVMGLIANYDIAKAYYLPIICYVVIFLFGYRFYKTSENINHGTI